MSARTSILEQFRSLPMADRLALLDELVLDVGGAGRGGTLDDTTAAFLDERLQYALDHPDEDRDWHDIRDEARAKR